METVQELQPVVIQEMPQVIDLEALVQGLFDETVEVPLASASETPQAYGESVEIVPTGSPEGTGEDDELLKTVNPMEIHDLVPLHPQDRAIAPGNPMGRLPIPRIIGKFDPEKNARQLGRLHLICVQYRAI